MPRGTITTSLAKRIDRLVGIVAGIESGLTDNNGNNFPALCMHKKTRLWRVLLWMAFP
jgi:hypothetical protein